MKKLYLCLLIIAALWGSIGQLSATLMIPLAVEDLTRRADLVLHGTVASKVCLKDQEGRIYTRIEFNVTEVWKGTLATNTFIIVHGGGAVGNERTEVDGEASYQVGEELVSFVRLNQRGEGVSIGLAQGKFKVWQDDATGERFAHNPFHGKPKHAEPEGQAKLQKVVGEPTRLDLATLRAQVNGGGR